MWKGGSRCCDQIMLCQGGMGIEMEMGVYERDESRREIWSCFFAIEGNLAFCAVSRRDGVKSRQGNWLGHWYFICASAGRRRSRCGCTDLDRMSTSSGWNVVARIIAVFRDAWACLRMLAVL